MAEKDPIDRTHASAEAENDAAFAARVLADLPSVAVPGTLQARILADLDAVAAKRRARWAWILRPARGLRDAVWPGAPAWKPASVFALSLLIGLMAGTLIPASALTSVTSVQDETVAVDTVPSLEISGDF